MQELTLIEIEEVGGAGFFSRVGSALGFVVGMGTAMQQRINSMDDVMLGAMQYGA
jgi:hypothetical protein